MNNARRTAIVSALANRLALHGSWCGETHLQKATYFLEELKGVPLGFGFTLYMHGPYSFDLRDHLTAMRADAYLEVKPRPYPYGPSLVPTPRAQNLITRSAAVGRYRPLIDWVAETVGGRRVSELERLTTALYITLRMPDATEADRAKRIHELKPHVSYSQALDAVHEIEKLASEGP